MSASTRTYYSSPAGSIAVDSLTKQVLVVVNRLLTLPKFGGESEPMTGTQGSFRPYTSYSGSTHTKCGATDLTAYNWRNRLQLFDLCGVDTFHRLKSEGDWPEHLHNATRGLGCNARALTGQSESLKAGRNGLRNNGPDRDRELRSLIWPLAIYQGRTGYVVATKATHLYDGPAGSRKVLRDAPKGTRVNAIMEVRNHHDNVWFVTDQGEWGFSGKWTKP